MPHASDLPIVNKYDVRYPMWWAAAIARTLRIGRYAIGVRSIGTSRLGWFRPARP